jgi:hypothetical protein
VTETEQLPIGIPPPELIGSAASKRCSSLTVTWPVSERSTSTCWKVAPGSSTACTTTCDACTATVFSSNLQATTASVASIVSVRRARRIKNRS